MFIRPEGFGNSNRAVIVVSLKLCQERTLGPAVVVTSRMTFAKGNRRRLGTLGIFCLLYEIKEHVKDVGAVLFCFNFIADALASMGVSRAKNTEIVVQSTKRWFQFKMI